jgi:phage terminase large subunit-like protein
VPKTKARGRAPSKSVDPGQQAVDFINLLTHTGDFNGVPFALRPWQEAIIRQLFGTLRPDGRRQYTKLFLALPRKQGKTELAAAILLYLLLGTGKRDQQLYSASGDREQAALIYRAAASMVRNDLQLDDVCHVYDGYNRIARDSLHSLYDALSS